MPHFCRPRDIAEFAEVMLRGKTIPESLEVVEHHLAVCGECREEFEALMEVLRGVGELVWQH